MAKWACILIYFRKKQKSRLTFAMFYRIPTGTRFYEMLISSQQVLFILKLPVFFKIFQRIVLLFLAQGVNLA